jgi:two-component system, NarL family, nitrate/nitrite response regulator NarL
VEDDILLAESLAVALRTQGWTVTTQAAAEASGPAVLVEAILAMNPAVVLLDLDLSSVEDGMTLVEPLSRNGCAVVTMTVDEDRSRWGRALASGAHATLPKSAGLTRMLQALHGAVAGEPLIAAEERSELIRYWQQWRLREDGHQTRLDRLTPRESQVLAQLASGKRVSEIARSSQVSRATVRTQVRSILAKLKVNSQIAAVAIVRDVGWSPPRVLDDRLPPDQSVGAGS